MDKNDTTRFLFQHIQPQTRLQTDGGGGRAIKRSCVTHRTDIHRDLSSVSSEIEGMFGNLRTFIRRMYHHATPEYLPEYVGEFCLRFSSPEIFDSPLAYLEKPLSLFHLTRDTHHFGLPKSRLLC